MGRKKIEIKLIKNQRIRRITFIKRRSGLLKKIKQLALLCKSKIKMEIIDEDGNQQEINSDDLIRQDQITIKNVKQQEPYSESTSKNRQKQQEQIKSYESNINYQNYLPTFQQNMTFPIEVLPQYNNIGYCNQYPNYGQNQVIWRF